MLEEGEQLAAEHAAEHAHGEEEPMPGCQPTGVIERQPVSRNEAVQVRMMTQVLRPGVQHGEHADTRAEIGEALLVVRTHNFMGERSSCDH
jgi:hypothetical protein